MVKRRVVKARLAHSFAGRFLGAKAYILVFLEVFNVCFFPNVFVALESGSLIVDTLFKGSYSSLVEERRFVIAWRGVDSEGVCLLIRRTSALLRVDLTIVIEGPLAVSSTLSLKCI